MMGGFGFSTQGEALMNRLKPDFGVVGEPDDMFAHFDDVLAHRHLDRIANLTYRSGGAYAFNPRVFLPPANHVEYNEAIFRDLFNFYGEERITGPEALHVPVEIQRGCPHRCYFCTEPTVKGRRHRTRDLDVVMADIRFLADRDVSRVWLVCSEINIGNNKLLFEMADRMRELNRGRTKHMAWSSYVLPNPQLERDEIRALLNSAFEPSWNQFTSYHDENLKKTRVPYRARHAIKSQLYWLEEEEDFRREQGRPAQPLRLDMFLGNSYATAETVSTTLRVANELRFADRFDDALITRATRVFDLGEGLIGDSAESAYTFTPRGRLDEIDLLYPTFSYPQELVKELGSAMAVDAFFAYVEDTFLSHAQRSRHDWRTFLTEAVDTNLLNEWCEELRSVRGR
ncbi:MAG: hypothetical protein ACRDRT_12130, partial [Pseudonocardiaceae bacterium]